MASALAISVAAPTRTEAQSSAAAAYRQAQAVGTVQAYEDFIARYPLSDEASDAFLNIVSISRGSRVEGGIQRGLTVAPTSRASGTGASTGVSPSPY